MSRAPSSFPYFTFINHACFMLRTDGALLRADPWFEGSVLDGAWSLVDASTSSDRMIETLNAAGVPVYIWCSRAQPGWFALPFLQRFRSEFRGIATFLYRPGRDLRLAGELLHHKVSVAACPDGVTVALAGDLRLTALANGDADTACLIGCGRRSILHLGERALASAAACQAAAPRIARLAPRIDLLLSGFGRMGWCGNPEAGAERAAAAGAAAERLAAQVECFRPGLVVPIASFARFARIDNAWLNGGRLAPADLLAAPRLEAARPLLRFLAPGAGIDLQRDTPATLAPAHHLALAHWAACWRLRPAPLPHPPPSSLGELKTAFSRYRAQVGTSMHLLPRALEAAGWLRPLWLHLPDLRLTVELSYRYGLRLLPRDTAAHVAMFSGTALQLLRAEDGYDTVVAGGCFRTLRRSGLSAFGRFFLPQRMTGRGADRHRPLAMGSFLLRVLVSRLKRRPHGASG